MRTLLSLSLMLTTASAVAQVPKAAVEDPNKQQVVPALADVPKPDKGYGTVVGQFVFDGKVPDRILLHKKGDPSVKDGGSCATKDHYRNDLVVNEKNMGIQNIFFYEKRGAYSKKKDAVHPDLRKPKNKEVYFDQKGCRFMPKALLVRAGQTVVVLSDDEVNHNTNMKPLKNQPMNVMIGAKDREGTPFPLKKGETAPIEVACDLHPWMRANWLVMDHPYMAVSNKDGRFMVANLPAGKHEVRLWHRIPGYLHKKIGTAKTAEYEVKKGKMYFEVKSGEVLDLKQIKLKAEWFEGK